MKAFFVEKRILAIILHSVAYIFLFSSSEKFLIPFPTAIAIGAGGGGGVLVIASLLIMALCIIRVKKWKVKAILSGNVVILRSTSLFAQLQTCNQPR